MLEELIGVVVVAIFIYLFKQKKKERAEIYKELDEWKDMYETRPLDPMDICKKPPLHPPKDDMLDDPMDLSYDGDTEASDYEIKANFYGADLFED